MRRFTDDERRARLARRHFLSEPADAVDRVVGAVVGLHATDPATPYLSLWSRLPVFTTADLDAELYERRSLVKHLAMRRTLWTVRSGDLPAVQAAASDRVADTERRRLIADAQKAGVCADGEVWLDAARGAVLQYLAANGPTDAKALRVALPELAGVWDPAPGKRWGGETPLAPRILTVLSVQGDIVRGPNDGRWTTSRPRWTSAETWIEPTQAVASEAARALVLRRWLAAFGPATLTDVKWWFGNTLTWARQGLRDIDAVEVDLAGTPGFVLPDDLDEEPEPDPWCALLPGLDVTTMGWFERDWYLGPHRGQVFDTNGNAGPTAWCDGRVVGAWVQDDGGRVEVRLLEDVGTAAHRALQRRAAELTDWLDGVRVSPRFPSPLTKR
ncbi:Winged helix DNA-binding domain-containing protein [Mycolicibacterium rutilum]|uniref:Winged helix DNA-binding domain-containing protein n=1 Tax=Mycolicibacterium rutilum TaxID=370526 RepID=A0A1H6L1D0_MYCRU|nr:winged helix DNA-binding domain-containing protein [Mycolicibacterium rutilum]SEH80056.1 Winged helix DNA-binding domain-containing protein [Mycolicibacterium rutilum]